MDSTLILEIKVRETIPTRAEIIFKRITSTKIVFFNETKLKAQEAAVADVPISTATELILNISLPHNVDEG